MEDAVITLPCYFVHHFSIWFEVFAADLLWQTTTLNPALGALVLCHRLVKRHIISVKIPCSTVQTRRSNVNRQAVRFGNNGSVVLRDDKCSKCKANKMFNGSRKMTPKQEAGAKCIGCSFNFAPTELSILYKE